MNCKSNGKKATPANQATNQRFRFMIAQITTLCVNQWLSEPAKKVLEGASKVKCRLSSGWSGVFGSSFYLRLRVRLRHERRHEANAHTATPWEQTRRERAKLGNAH